ncbi:hypothetical protein C0Q70_01307 [Pomacea canaliculata]|uniref:SH3 domain-containing protein n=1 Tax=Pomacea canaliculata TaxID=400727 RepID=A0A2T7PZ65_POMCA|nr:hypothetical protein C0Q70_01307 [Pomacea canaliculata]
MLQVKICNSNFENNNIAIQQALDELREERELIRNSHTREWMTAEEEHDITEDLHLQRKRGLESILYITELESSLTYVQDDFETRAIYLAQRPEVFRSVYRHHHQAASRMHTAILSHLLQLEARVSRLCDSCRLVVPVHLRKQGTAVKPLRAEVLVNYCHRQISLQKDDTCTIVDNSDPERWRVLTKDGQEAEVPSIILVIPAPDPESFRAAHRVRSQLAVHWSTTAQRLGSQLVQFISIIGKDTQTKELAAVSSDQKAALMKMMNDILRTLPAGDSNFAAMKTEVVRLRKLLVQVKPGARVASNQTVKMWEGTMAAYQVFADFLVYAHAYRVQLGEHVTEESVLAADPVCPPAYVSRAYFERALPSVSIDINTKRSQVTGVQCQIYIHERHRGPRDGGATPLHGAARTESRALQHAAGPLESSSPQASSVVIVGVLDPRQGQISAHQAIQRGILNLTSGTYHSPVSGACLSLPAAIEQGLVQVDFCRTQAGGESFDVPDGGEAKLTSQLETLMCPISGVVDPASGEWVSTKDAVTRGLINPHTATFRNSLTGEQMSLGDAVKAGFLIAEQVLPPEENSDDVGVFTSVVWLELSHKVSGVVDLRSGDIISLKRALQAGLVDPVKGTYRDAVSGEVMGIEEALRRGQDEGDVLTFQQLQIQRQRFLPLTDTDSVLQEDLVQDSNTKLLQHLLERVDPSRVAVKEVSTGRTISLQEAFDKGIVNLAAAQFDTLVGNLLPIQEAAASGYIEPTILKDILNTYQGFSIGNLIQQGKFDPDTGLVTDISTGRTLSLETAIECNLIDAGTTFFFDVSANRFVSMEEALKTGRMSRTTGRVVVTENGHELSVKEAEQQGYILTNPDPG